MQRVRDAAFLHSSTDEDKLITTPAGSTLHPETKSFEPILDKDKSRA